MIPSRAQRRVRCHAAPAQQTVDAWTRAQDMFSKGQAHVGTVRGVNRGGIVVDCWGVAGVTRSHRDA